jgi:hypothetical protein
MSIVIGFGATPVKVTVPVMLPAVAGSTIGAGVAAGVVEDFLQAKRVSVARRRRAEVRFIRTSLGDEGKNKSFERQGREGNARCMQWRARAAARGR